VGQKITSFYLTNRLEINYSCGITVESAVASRIFFYLKTEAVRMRENSPAVIALD